VAAVLLALASSVMWGAADFGGGWLTRRLPLAAVTVVSQAAGLALLLVLVAVVGHVNAHSLGIGAVGGVAGGAGLACFYAALARGTMSIVSPVTACSALVPVALSLAAGERPSALALAGSAMALTGAVLASVEEREAAERGRRDAILLAVGAAVAIGVFIYFLGRAADDGSALSALFGARLGSLGLLITWALAVGARPGTFRLGRAAVAAIVLVGLADVSANALFALASQRGLLAIVSVLGSLFPIVTVVLAHIVLGERITLVQRAGVVVALAGVAVVSVA
jgi:drug/metabolite transporter (DMT)-like permease